MSDLFKKTRVEKVIIARQMAMYIFKEKLGFSYAETGRIMAREGQAFNHTTVMSNVKMFRNRLETNEEEVVVPYKKVAEYMDISHPIIDKREKLTIYYSSGHHPVHSIIKVLNENFEELNYEFE